MTRRAWTADELLQVLDLLIATHLDAGVNEVRSVRTALCVELSRHAALGAAATDALAFPTAQAARHATRRAEQLLAASPDLRRIAAITLGLAT